MPPNPSPRTLRLIFGMGIAALLLVVFASLGGGQYVSNLLARAGIAPSSQGAGCFAGFCWSENYGPLAGPPIYYFGAYPVNYGDFSTLIWSTGSNMYCLLGGGQFTTVYYQQCPVYGTICDGKGVCTQGITGYEQCPSPSYQDTTVSANASAGIGLVYGQSIGYSLTCLNQWETGIGTTYATTIAYTNPPPYVNTLYAVPASITLDGSNSQYSTIGWATLYADYCYVDGYGVNSYDSSGPGGNCTTGAVHTVTTPALTSPGTYWYTAHYYTSGIGWAAGPPVSVTVSAPPPAACTSAPNICGMTTSGSKPYGGSCSAVTPPDSSCSTVSLSPAAVTVEHGGSTTLTATATYVTAGSCWISNPAGGSVWNDPTTGGGNTSFSTPVLVSNITQGGNYTLSCQSATGARTAATAVTVATTTLSAIPAFVTAGQSATLNWTVANVTANSCTISGSGLGLTADSSGGGNNWTPQNISATDRSTDTPGGVAQYSLSFNGTNQYLSRTPTIAGNTKTWTLSLWLKSSGLDLLANAYLFGAGGAVGSRSVVYLQSTDDSGAYQPVPGGTGSSLVSTLFPQGVWTHVVVAASTAQANASDRIKLYINGTQVSSFSDQSYPALNFSTYIDSLTAHVLGKEAGGSAYFSGKLAEVNFVDGQQLTPSAFAQSGAPKNYTGSYGTNGFHLSFASSGFSGTHASTAGGVLGTGPISSDASYTISCSVAGGGTVSSSVTIPVDICTDIPGAQSAVPSGCQQPVAGICIPPGKIWDGVQCSAVVPAINSFGGLSLTGSRVRKGNPAYFSWSVVGLGAGTSCSISPALAQGSSQFIGDGVSTTWSGTGVQSAPINAPTVFTLSCTPPGGTPVSASATINLLPGSKEI